MRCSFAILAAALLLACASAPPAPAPGRAGAFGYLKLVPREGVVPASGGSHAYGDREFEGVAFVDYSKPGFAVVYADAATAEHAPAGAGNRIVVTIRAGATHPVFDPPHAALGAGGEISVANQSGEPHLVSCPSAGLVKRIAPGESIAIPVPKPGEWPLYLLDVAGEQAAVFAAPGPYHVVSTSGRFELPDLEPGRAQLHAWHPRFPPTSIWVDLVAGTNQRVDFALRVGEREGNRADAQ